MFDPLFVGIYLTKPNKLTRIAVKCVGFHAYFLDFSLYKILKVASVCDVSSTTVQPNLRADR